MAIKEIHQAKGLLWKKITCLNGILVQVDLLPVNSEIFALGYS